MQMNRLSLAIPAKLKKEVERYCLKESKKLGRKYSVGQLIRELLEKEIELKSEKE